MKKLPLLALLAIVALAGTAEPSRPPVPRRELLSAALPEAAPVAAVEAKEVTLPAGLAAGAHEHPGDVVGVVLAGTIAFQVAGGPLRVLQAGDAFHEPAGARIERFDNTGDGPARFVAFYLVRAGQRDLIRPLAR